jgi:hypothetical protein
MELAAKIVFENCNAQQSRAQAGEKPMHQLLCIRQDHAQRRIRL